MSFTIPANGLIPRPPVPTPVITSSELQYRYDWTAAAEHDNARITGFPDNVLLARHEGYEVLPFLNRFCRATTHGTGGAQFGKADALKAERMIHTSLPSNFRSHAHVNAWLVQNWASYR